MSSSWTRGCASKCPLICGYLQRRTPRGTWVLRWWALERKSYVDRLCIYHDHAGYLKGERLTALTMKRVVSVAKISFNEPAHKHEICVAT